MKLLKKGALNLSQVQYHDAQCHPAYCRFLASLSAIPFHIFSLSDETSAPLRFVHNCLCTSVLESPSRPVWVFLMLVHSVESRAPCRVARAENFVCQDSFWIMTCSLSISVYGFFEKSTFVVSLQIVPYSKNGAVSKAQGKKRERQLPFFSAKRKVRK